MGTIIPQSMFDQALGKLFTGTGPDRICSSKIAAGTVQLRTSATADCESVLETWHRIKAEARRLGHPKVFSIADLDREAVGALMGVTVSIDGAGIRAVFPILESTLAHGELVTVTISDWVLREMYSW